MSRVDLHRVETDGIRTPCGIAELRHDRMDFVHAQCTRGTQRSVCVRARAYGLPSAEFLRHALIVESYGEATGGGLATRMVELHGHGRTGGLGIRHDPSPCFHLIVAPQSQVAGRDTSFRRHGGGFHDDHAETAHGTRYIMLVVEWRREAILCECRIRVHRRQPDAITHGHSAQGHRFEQPHRTLLLAFFLGFLAVAHDSASLSHSITVRI